MIRAMFNLRCSAGHYHYSPTPKFWLGMTCYKPLGQSLTRGGLKCDKPLRAAK